MVAGTAGRLHLDLRVGDRELTRDKGKLGLLRAHLPDTLPPTMSLLEPSSFDPPKDEHFFALLT